MLQILTLCFMFNLALADKCPRPEEIAPCQCRTRGPTIQVLHKNPDLILKSSVFYLGGIETQFLNSKLKSNDDFSPHLAVEF